MLETTRMAGYDKMIMVPEIPQATQTIESQEKRKTHTRPRKKKGEKNPIKECTRRRKKKKKACSNDKLLELLIDLI